MNGILKPGEKISLLISTAMLLYKQTLKCKKDESWVGIQCLTFLGVHSLMFGFQKHILSSCIELK